ncbi:MAG TPA: hypothetical protein PK200_13735 [Spirochaetota bacterium]|nr:hypothetical protein [Spirochaetota bacterium]
MGKLKISICIRTHEKINTVVNINPHRRSIIEPEIAGTITAVLAIIVSLVKCSVIKNMMPHTAYTLLAVMTLYDRNIFM